VLETDGNGEVSVVTFGGLVQGCGDGGKWKEFSCDVC
jgi:hypothetical protein